MSAIYESQAKSLDIAREVFAIEKQALEESMQNLDSNFVKAVETILSIEGKVIVTGMGKSGHIGAKIAASLASTGTPAFFVHPAEMGHGDLGMLTDKDIVLALSYSGNTDEIRKILAPIKKLGLKLIAITGAENSILASCSDIILLTPISKEACPLDLAPTSSTTAALVMGDALAIALMQAKNFQKQDFAKSHPLGSLGKSFVQIQELMRFYNLPKVSPELTFRELLLEISDKALGFAIVINSKSQVIGSITDGDLRRAQLKFEQAIFEKRAKDIMNPNPKLIRPDIYAMQAAEIMKEHRISTLIVVDDKDQALGILDLKDILAEGFII